MKTAGKSTELLIGSWFLKSGIEVFLPTAQDVQADMVVLVRKENSESILDFTQNKNILPPIQPFAPKGNEIQKEDFYIESPTSLSPLGQPKTLYAIEVKTGTNGEDDAPLDFDFLVYLDEEFNRGAITAVKRFEGMSARNHFPMDNGLTLQSPPNPTNGWIQLPDSVAGKYPSIVYFGLPALPDLQANFFVGLFLNFATGRLR